MPSLGLTLWLLVAVNAWHDALTPAVRNRLHRAGRLPVLPRERRAEVLRAAQRIGHTAAAEAGAGGPVPVADGAQPAAPGEDAGRAVAYASSFPSGVPRASTQLPPIPGCGSLLGQGMGSRTCQDGAQGQPDARDPTPRGAIAPAWRLCDLYEGVWTERSIEPSSEATAAATVPVPT